MEVRNIYEDLKNAKKDEAVGIRSIRLSGDDDFALYAAEIDGNKSIGAHYHTKGNEIYQVVEGTSTSITKYQFRKTHNYICMSLFSYKY